MAPEDDHNTDSLVWRLGMVSKPRRCHEHPWAYRYAYETHTSHPPSPTVRPRTQYRGRLPTSALCRWGFATACISGQTSRFWGLRASEREGFKGEWMRRLWGRINTRNIEGRETQGVLGQTSEGMQWVWGIESEEIWRRVNAIEWGEMQGVYSKSKEF